MFDIAFPLPTKHQLLICVTTEDVDKERGHIYFRKISEISLRKALIERVSSTENIYLFFLLKNSQMLIFVPRCVISIICRLCTSQLKPPPLGSRGRVGDLTVTPVKRHQYPYSLRLEFRSNAPTPEARKMKISKLSKKRHVFKRRKFPSLHVQVCSSD